jgi:hypothetical protein
VEWGILIQRAMNARFIIIRGILTQDPAQVRLPLGQKIEAVEKTGILSRSGVASSGGVAYDL